MFRAAGGTFPVGICPADNTQAAAIVNLAQEQLIHDPMAPDEGWWGGWVKMLFTLHAVNLSAFLVTPHDIARVILMDVCKKPVRIRNGFYEYLEFGIGLQPRSCHPQVCAPSTMQAYERDSVVTLSDFAATPQILRVFVTNNADLGKRICIQGTDPNGNTIRGEDANTRTATLGETIFFKGPFAQSLNTFASVTGILKDATLGPVQIFMIDPTTGASATLTTLEPNETTAQYRRYMVNGLPCACCNTPGGQIQVEAQCKIDFVPVFADSDYLTIQSIPALIEQCQSIRYSRMDTEVAAKLEAKHHARAIALLDCQLDHFAGKINTAVTVPLFGSDRLKPMPI